MNKQTSIEWLEHKLNSVKPTDFCSIETIKEWLIEAKQMHKEEITKAFDEGYDLRDTDGTLLYHDGASTRYYQETYGGNNE